MFRCVCVKSIKWDYEVIFKIQPVSLINYLCVCVCVCVCPCPWSLTQSAFQKCLLNVKLIAMARMKTQGKECCRLLGMDYSGGQCCGEHGLSIHGGLEAQGSQMTCSRSHSQKHPKACAFSSRATASTVTSAPFAFVLPVSPHSVPASLGPSPLLRLHVRTRGVSPCA